jgi:hypothetical protein
MLDYLPYIIIFILLIVFTVFFYIRAKFGFWVSQPVFHIYDLYYYIHPVGIINHVLPKKNKYTNFKDINTYVFTDLIDYQVQRFVHFIRRYFYREKNGHFLPDVNNITPYLTNNQHHTFVSFYTEEQKLLDSKGDIIDNPRIIGVMTSKPLNIYITKDNASFDCYYIDYLCVDKGFRKKGIAPQIIQTHHYNQSHLNKKISVSLFKREGELTGIIPLCIYDTYGFSVTSWTKPIDLSGDYQFVLVNKTNISIFLHFLTEMKEQFEITACVCLSNLLELIESNNIFISMLIQHDQIHSCYFFRKTCVIYNGLESLSCFASINNTQNTQKELFIHGFKISFWKIAEKNHFGYCIIENISHNTIIVDNLLLKTNADIKSSTAYFFYNFAYSTFSHKNTLIIN